MSKSAPTMAQQVALAASDFQQQQTGVAPQSVTVVLSENTLVITLHGALSKAEMALAKSSAGAAQVQEFHRQLFTTSCDMLRQAIQRITGVDVCGANVDGESTINTVVQVFPTGTMVQVFLLARGVPEAIWNGNGIDAS